MFFNQFKNPPTMGFSFMSLSFIGISLQNYFSNGSLFVIFFMAIAGLSGLGFVFFNIFKEYKIWNKGICKETGLYWLQNEHTLNWTGNCFISKHKEPIYTFGKFFNNSYQKIQLQFYCPNYDEEKAKLYNEHIDIINKVKDF